MFCLLCVIAFDGLWFNLSGGGTVYLQHEPYAQALELKTDFTKLTWSGSLKDGLPDGKGLLEGYLDGELIMSYKGSLRKGSFHGKGKLFRAGGLLDLYYRGSFRQGYREGKGNLQLVPPGQPKQRFAVNYEGQWRNHAFDGKGELYNKLERSLYRGEFRNGLYHGEGKLLKRTSTSVDYWGQRSFSAHREETLQQARWEVARQGRWVNGKFAGDDE